MTLDIDPRVDAQVRDVTDDEVSFYEKNGWVMLRGLISSRLAAELKQLGESRVQPGLYPEDGMKRFIAGADERVEPLYSFNYCETMGRNAQRLFNRQRLATKDVAVRARGHGMIYSRGRSTGQLTEAALYHQDSPEHGSDRVGEFNQWIALDEVTPQMGAMRFLTGVHREGPLGVVLNEIADDWTSDLLRIYPRLLDVYPPCPPLHYQPGDSTVHHGHMVHYSPPNETDRLRWSLLVSYAPADTRYYASSEGNPGGKRVVPSDEDSPIIWPAEPDEELAGD